MYNIFKSRITTGGYKLADIQHRIKKLYAMGNLTDEQLDELLTVAQQNASADAERPEILSLIQNLANRVEALEKKQNSTEEETEGYEAWTPWNGISDDYQPGAIVSHNGQLWQSVHSGQNTWEPGTVGTESLWAAYTPDTEEE